MDVMEGGPSIKRPSCVSRHDIRDDGQGLEGGRTALVRLTGRDWSGDGAEPSGFWMVESRGKGRDEGFGGVSRSHSELERGGGSED